MQNLYITEDLEQTSNNYNKSIINYNYLRFIYMKDNSIF